MKFFSPTRSKVHLRCPKRFYFRYLHEEPSLRGAAEHARRHQLYGIRELAGHLVHQTLAVMVRALADGDHSWRYESAGILCRDEFLSIAAKSLALEPEEWEGGPQLAETFNGLEAGQIEEELRFWRDMIPTLIENGFRAALRLKIMQQTSIYSVEAERRVEWKRPGGIHRMVLDVVTQSKYQTICIDWKCHAIDNIDINQVRSYLRYLHAKEGVQPSKLFGFAVDLKNEEIIEVKFEPHRSLHAVPASFSAPLRLPSSGRVGDPYPAKPHAESCARCAYSSQCPSSMTPGHAMAQLQVAA